MRWFMLTLAALAIVVVLPAGRGGAYPKPEENDEGHWTLKIQFRPMRMISVADSVTGKKVLYWYLLYTVTNSTDSDDVQFNPDFTMLTDGNMVYRDVLDSNAFQAIKRKHQDMLLMNPLEISGRIPPGVGFARDGVAIFKDIDRTTDAFKIFVSGISDNSLSVVNPVTGKEAYLFKTLERSYRQPGDSVEVNRDKILFVGERYIYR
jgi:hypothetical protein